MFALHVYGSISVNPVLRPYALFPERSIPRSMRPFPVKSPRRTGIVSIAGSFTILVVLFGSIHSSTPLKQSDPRRNQAGTPRCRCLPDDSCWPIYKHWKALNNTLNGRLIVPRPTAYPCYAGPGYDPEKCHAVRDNYNQTIFLVGQPGSMQFPNLEELDDQRCSLEGALNGHDICRSGRVPAYAADAHTVVDIQRALAFARQHNLRVVVKSTGHDNIGRSTAPGALLIWLHNFQGELRIEESFTSSGCGKKYRNEGMVITVPAGKIFDEVYTKIDKDLNRRYVFLGGYCPDVGASGGYVLGGGYGLLSPSFGLAVDNVLEMTIVTADGQHLTANACQNKDLFWALRGGGGGTFGVVTSVTYKLHPVPDGLTAYSIFIRAANNTGQLSPGQVEEIWEVLARRTAELDDDGWGAIFCFGPSFGFGIMLMMPTHRMGSLAAVETLKDELVGIQEWRQWMESTGVFDESGGTRTEFANRLIPASALHKSRHAAQNLVNGAVKNDWNKGLVCELAVGQGVRKQDPGSLKTSVLPAWRKAAYYCLIYADWPVTASQEEVDRKKVALDAGIQVWRDAFPDSGTYLNEANAEEPNWPESFWGDNYRRLIRVKNAVDPDGMFVCSKCVGSEDWDSSGNCRLLEGKLT